MLGILALSLASLGNIPHLPAAPGDTTHIEADEAVMTTQFIIFKAFYHGCETLIFWDLDSNTMEALENSCIVEKLESQDPDS